MIVEFLPEAKAELFDAVTYFTKANCLDWASASGMTSIGTSTGSQKNAEVPRLRDGGYRRVNLTEFPYYLAYIVRDPVIWILSVAHSHSLPQYWIDRA